MANSQDISIYQLTRLVEELLFVHDCVIVPGFGGFVGKTVPASMDSEQGLFLPPGKRIAFNGQLTHNDGLLVAALANKYQLRFEAADARVQAFCQEIKTLLLRDKRLIFGRIGSFMQAGSSQLFEPSHDINFLLGSYGLPTLRLQANTLLHTEEVRQAPKEVVVINKATDKNSVLRYMASAISIPAAILVLAWPFFQPSQKQNNTNTSGYSFSDEPVTTYKPRQVLAYPLGFDSLAALPPVSTILAEQKEKKSAAPAFSTAVKTQDPADTMTQEQFLLIAGCFKSEENALKLVEELTFKGFDARMAGQNSAGLYRVALGPASTRDNLQQDYSQALAQGYSVWWLHQ